MPIILKDTSFGLSVGLLLCFAVSQSGSSLGDRTEVYQRCIYWCSEQNCSNSTRLAHFKNGQPWYLSFLSWECWDECGYNCMWHAVNLLQSRGYPVPQFHGKWPFIRIFGIQEPASFVFSIMNGFSHYIMWQRFKKSFPNFTIFNVWNIQAMLSINAWIWSSVFHARDTPVTEKLDYYCAFSLVIYSLYCLLIKALSKSLPWMPLILSVPFFSFFAYHVYYLTFVKFDYGYNLKANVFLGLVNSLGWIFWCYTNKRKPYVWKCAMSVLTVNVLLLLELLDFPPLGFLVDAHALWHLGTIPVPILWYNFLIEDCLHDVKQKQKVL